MTRSLTVYFLRAALASHCFRLTAPRLLIVVYTRLDLLRPYYTIAIIMDPERTMGTRSSGKAGGEASKKKPAAVLLGGGGGTTKIVHTDTAVGEY